ncbi:MAG: dipeptidase PepV [Streptococcaceae bacterium]|jgi:dipeptidase PepV|nr:dipeptidase PepV [Streptococcaceae bacterium]
MVEINFTEEVTKRKDALMADLDKMLRINSERNDALADKENPFGPGPRAALDAFLALAKRDGYATTNVDNYVGHFEYENGAADDAEVLGIFAHLDVVPAAEQLGWETNPYEPVIKDGNLYARGASDDKGPTMACYYGLKILKELNVPLSKKIRFIAGTDEESGWSDMDYYFAHYDGKLPDFGFSPDAEFPIINGEKGNVTEFLHYDGSNGGTVTLESFTSGLRFNMVPEVATAVISGETDDLKAALDAFVAKFAEKKITYTLAQANGKATLVLNGKGAHGAMPEMGVNAATYLAAFLDTLDFGGAAKEYLHIGGVTLLEDHAAERLGTAYNDALMGGMTVNPGVWNFKAGEDSTIALNFRFPQGTDKDVIKSVLVKLSGVVDVEIAPHDMNPHYVPQEDELVKTLLAVYEKHTGLKGYETIIGGGTFGRLLKRGVAYGAMFEGEVDTMHQANEFKPVAAILKAAAIYAEAIYELAK